MNIDLSNKVAFVTGASNDIGKATVKILAKCGANVGIMDQHFKSTIEMEAGINTKSGGSVFAIPGNVFDPVDLENGIWQTVEVFGALHLAVNNAGIAWDPALIHERPIDRWRKVVRVNLDSAFYAIKYEMTEMMRCGGGSIVNISYTEEPMALRPDYQTCKHLIAGLVRTIAADYADSGIRINTVSTRAVKSSSAMSKHGNRTRVKSVNPLGLTASPQEVAKAVVFLLSDLSVCTTGTDFVIGGASCIGDI